jgi:hypothetical protein
MGRLLLSLRRMRRVEGREKREGRDRGGGCGREREAARVR